MDVEIIRSGIHEMENGRLVFLPLMSKDSEWADVLSAVPDRRGYEARYPLVKHSFGIANTIDMTRLIYLG